MNSEANSPQHDSPAPPPLPELRDAVLSHDEVLALASDLNSLTTIGSILEKGAATSRAGDSNPSLDEAIARLTSGQVRAIQIRYRYDHHEWTDTLMALPTGFRLVRCRHEM